MNWSEAVAILLMADSYVGRRWKNGRGEDREVTRLINTQRGPRYLVSTNGERFGEELVAPEDLDKLMAQEQRMYESNTKFRADQQKIIDKEAADSAAKSSLDGFEQTLAPMARGKAIKALTTKGVRGNGKFYPSLRDFIRDIVGKGKRTIRMTRHSGRVLEDADGNFISEKQITKLGMDYAAYLLEKHK